MIKKQLALLLAGMMTTLVWAQDSVVKVEGGLLQGIPSSASEITVFKGIPYAVPPVLVRQITLEQTSKQEKSV